MPMYRMANITVWQTDTPEEIRGYWSVFLRTGPKDTTTLARGDFRSKAPVDKPPTEWLLEALASMTSL